MQMAGVCRVRGPGAVLGQSRGTAPVKTAADWLFGAYCVTICAEVLFSVTVVEEIGISSALKLYVTCTCTVLPGLLFGFHVTPTVNCVLSSAVTLASASAWTSTTAAAWPLALPRVDAQRAARCAANAMEL